MTPTEAAWLAGFIDGEGTIYHVMAKGRYSQWKLSVGNTHFPSIEYCQRIAGGIGTVQRYERSADPPAARTTKLGWSEKRKPFLSWRVTTWADTVSLCRQMLPYLITKRELAQRCIDENAALEIH
jgi:hypothetical protein